MSFVFFSPKLRPGSRDRWTSVRYLPRVVRSLWHVSPAICSAIIAVRIACSVQPAAVLYFGKLIVDEIVRQSQLAPPGPFLNDWLVSGRSDTLLLLILTEFAIVITGSVLTRVGALLETLIGEAHSHYLITNLIDHVASLDLGIIESSQFQDKIQRANTAAAIGRSLLNSILSQFQVIITLTALVVGLMSIAPVMIFVLLACVIPIIIIEDHFNIKQYDSLATIAPERRKLQYFQTLGSNFEFAKEIKLFGLSEFISNQFRLSSTIILEINRSIATQRAAFSSIAGSISVAAYYGCYLYLAIGALKGSLSVGDLAFAAGALMKMNSILESLIMGLAQLASQAQFIRDYFAVIESNIPDEARSGRFPVPVQRGIVFKNVGFRYPGSQSWAVRNLNFEIPAGQTIAIVGENGAGKTTIVKLLTGLYYPTEGVITIDDIDIGSIEKRNLRENIGAIFQDYVRYNLSVSDNISVANQSKRSDLNLIREAAERSSAAEYIVQLPRGYDQLLGMLFEGGMELSGGQWQKLAIARAYFRDAPILILDEPTASLDARSEHDVFRQFAEISRGKTTLLISHRMSSARAADRIIVVENGTVAETGNHFDLIAMNGRYAEMFEIQSSGFR